MDRQREQRGKLTNVCNVCVCVGEKEETEKKAPEEKPN